MNERIDMLVETISNLVNSISSIGELFKNFISWFKYWFNPSNLIEELGILLSSPRFENGFIVITLILLIIRMVGAKWPTKFIWWGWVIYWITRVVL